MAAYPDQPIPDRRHIRLLKFNRLTPEDGTQANPSATLGPVRVDLQQWLLTETPAFTAVSYTWGSSPETRELEVGNDKWPVSRNAYDILQILRPRTDNDGRYFWMDQVCINQNDEKEKGHQVRIIRKIYQKASRTFLMLAEGNIDADPMLTQLSLLGLQPLRDPPNPFGRVGGPISLFRSNLKAHLPRVFWALLSNEFFRQDFESIVNNAVFTRAWIYQEIVSSRYACLIGSNVALDWDIFARAFELYRACGTRASNSSVDPSKFRILDMIVRDRITRQTRGYKDWTLLHTEAQGLLQARDLRDNTMALTTFEDFYLDIPPYQSLTVADLYKATTRAMTSASRSLDVFAALTGNPHLPEREREKMPSWVPDWSRGRDSTPLYWPHSITVFDAANGYPYVLEEARVKAPDERLVMTVRGKRVDSIVAQSRHRFEDFRDHMDLVEAFQFKAHGTRWLTHTKRQGHPLIEGKPTPQNWLPYATAMITAMTASFSTGNLSTNEAYLNHAPHMFYDELLFILGWYKEISAGEAVYHDGKPHSLSFIPTFYGNWQVGLEKLRQWTSICHGRRIAYGETQGFGLVPKTAEIGDIVCVLHGSKVPIVLRQVGNYYRVIGQCYWYERMDGSKVDWAESEGDRFELV